MTLAKNRAIDRFRSSNLERGWQVPLDQVVELPGNEAAPEQYSAGMERQRLVQEAMACLSSSARHRVVVLLGFESRRNRGPIEAAAGTAKTRMRLGMIRLREVLAPHGEGLLS